MRVCNSGTACGVSLVRDGIKSSGPAVAFLARKGLVDMPPQAGPWFSGYDGIKSNGHAITALGGRTVDLALKL